MKTAGNKAICQITGLLLGEHLNRRNLYFSVKTLAMAAGWFPIKKETLREAATESHRSVSTVRRRIRRWRKELSKIETPLK